MMTLYSRIGAAALLAVALFGAGYVKGRTDGRVAQLQDTVDAFEKRKTIDRDVQDMRPRALCIELGGVPDQCDQLRGVDQATQTK